VGGGASIRPVRPHTLSTADVLTRKPARNRRLGATHLGRLRDLGRRK